MTTIKFNDAPGIRDIRHLNLLIFEFAGESIPGVCQITSTSYTKNGKWSHSTWEVELAPGLRSFVWTQDWELGSGTWERAVADLQRKSGIPDLCPTAIRAKFPKAAAKLDRAAAEAQADPSEALQELLLAQAAQADAAQVRTEIAQLEQAAQARVDAAALQSRVAAARRAMAQGASLADLRSIMETHNA